MADEKAKDAAKVAVSGPKGDGDRFLFIIVVVIDDHEEMRPGPALKVAVEGHEYTEYGK